MQVIRIEKGQIPGKNSFYVYSPYSIKHCKNNRWVIYTNKLMILHGCLCKSIPITFNCFIIIINEIESYFAWHSIIMY